MENKIDDFKTRKELFEFLKKNKKSYLDKFICVRVRENVLFEIFEDTQETDKFWGEYRKKQERIEEKLKKELKRLEGEIKRIKKERENWKKMYHKLNKEAHKKTQAKS